MAMAQSTLSSCGTAGCVRERPRAYRCPRFGSKPSGAAESIRSRPAAAGELADVKRNKEKRKLRLQAEETAERDASAPGRAVLDRLTDAVARPVTPGPKA